MTEQSGFPRYDNLILAWEYDQRQPAPFPGELEWYLKYATLSGGPVLEHACGSGRLLIPIAEAGYQIDGVDASNAMLNRLKAKLNNRYKKMKDRIRLFNNDMMAFIPDKKYGLCILPYNSLQYLENPGKISLYFQRVSSLLRPNGYFLFMVRRPDFSDFIDGKRVVYDSMNNPSVDIENKLSIGSRFITRFDLVEHRIIHEHSFKILYNDGKSEEITEITQAPIIEVREYLGMLTQSGLNTRVYSGYDERPEDGNSRELCFVCKKDSQ